MLVDIIIPCFNPGKELIDALYSCKNQTYSNYRITLVDDASTSNVQRLIRDFEDINYIRSDENLGPSGARNLGIKNTEGDLISFLDSDDIMDKNKLKFSIKVLRDNSKVGMVCGNYQIIKDRSRIKKPFYTNPIRVNHSVLMRQNFVASGSVTVRRSVLDDVGLFDEKLWIAEDYDLWLRISERYDIGYIHKVLYYYSVVSGGSSLTQREDIQKDHDANIAKIREASRKRVDKNV
tara:strand:+ start:4938 stop:5642 length:705 start_codon:yes stop_codon:yes gene_type:complete